MLTLSFLCCAVFISAQSNKLEISYNNINLKLDNDKKQVLEASDLSLIQLNIATEQTLHMEDFKIKVNSKFQKIDEKIQLTEVNPSKNTTQKTYQLTFKLGNDKRTVDIDFSIKNEILNHSMKLQFYKNKNPLAISIVWKAPIQANRATKTGIGTILPKYVVNLEINSSEPLLENDFKILLNDIYQKNKVSPRKLKAKVIIGKHSKAIYQYDYTCEVKLHEGINQVKLEVSTKHYVPQQDKSYSSVLYINKVTE